MERSALLGDANLILTWILQRVPDLRKWEMEKWKGENVERSGMENECGNDSRRWEYVENGVQGDTVYYVDEREERNEGAGKIVK